jgi:S-adenosylmethionine-diacylglycerol 3-amino-3-carboxypropyl transferase
MKSEQELVLGAVAQKDSSTGQGFLQRLFAHWFDAFVYNQIWEDPRVDIEALMIDADSRILTISSGGCNALNYLLENPQSVTAVDLNRHHIYLLNLKIAAMSALDDYDEFFEFFGNGKGANAVPIFESRIAPELDDATRAFWLSKSLGGRLRYGRRIDIFGGSGLYDHSRNGYFLRFFHKFAHIAGCRPEEVLKAKSPAEQAELFQKWIAPFFDTFFIKLAGRMPITMFGLGIPPQQYAELLKDVESNGSVIDVYRERTRRLACDFPIDENYFAWQAFARKYDTEFRAAIPQYLKEENYEKLRANASRISTVIGSVTDEIRNRETGAFNRFVFLDAQDWMNAETMIELWNLIAERGGTDSRIIFRTAGAASPVEAHLPAELRKRFHYDEETSKTLFARDRASIYGGFHLYRRLG